MMVCEEQNLTRLIRRSKRNIYMVDMDVVLEAKGCLLHKYIDVVFGRSLREAYIYEVINTQKTRN
jgi:hypothetical protein